MVITKDKLLSRISGIRCWQRGEQRAPHKPLLLLLALARVQRGEPRTAPYLEFEKQLRGLLRDYGPPRRFVHPEHPLWRLANDGLWEVANRASIGRTSSGDPRVSELRQANPLAGFPTEIQLFLEERPSVVNEIAATLLERNFPPSLHNDILDAVGFPWVMERDRRRDPGFRERIIRIYENACAFCGYEGQLGRTNVGIEAAHVKWFAAGGPDIDQNGLALCALHHVLFDRGALGLDPERRILVSACYTGRELAQEAVLTLAGRSIRGPMLGEDGPGIEYMDWHRREVFHEPARAHPSPPPLGEEAPFPSGRGLG